MKYKLIKEYPGSLKLNTIIEIDSKQETGYYSENKEFWQPIVEKDYEILEIQGKYGSISSYKEQYDNDLKNKSIYKIKRLSDGEIFTIGDKVTHLNYQSKSFILHEIKLIDSEIKLLSFDSRSWLIYLNNAIKVKQPIFTTEQRFEIEKIIKNIIK